MSSPPIRGKSLLGPQMIGFGLVLLFAKSALLQQAGAGTQVKIGLESDMSRPTMGLHGQSESQMSYNNRDGFNMRGSINDLLGPPIKMAQGFGQMIAGSNMAGVGSSLSNDGAILGLDSKILEAAGGAKLLKGGLLFGGSAAKVGAAKVMGGLPGKKIASVIELPVKVVALKDLALGKHLVGLGKLKAAKSQQAQQEGAELASQGEVLKQQGLNQVLQGANEGMQNLNNMMTQASANANTAFKLLPIMLDLPMGQQPTQQEAVSSTKGGSQAPTKSQQYAASPPLIGGSLFGGLTSLIPGMSQDPLATGSVTGSMGLPFNWLAGNGQNGQHGYAAVLNSTNPLTNLIMNPASNPFLLPMTGSPFSQALSGGPLGQSVGAKTTGDSNSGFGGLFGLGGSNGYTNQGGLGGLGALGGLGTGLGGLGTGLGGGFGGLRGLGGGLGGLGGLGGGLGGVQQQQAIQQPLNGDGSQRISYSPLPGLHVTETMSMRFPNGKLQQQQLQQQPVQLPQQPVQLPQQPVQLPQQQLETKGSHSIKGGEAVKGGQNIIS